MAIEDLKTAPRESVRPSAGEPGPGRHHPLLSPEIVAGTTKLIDFGLVLAAAIIAFAIYFSVVPRASPGETQRYILITLLAATVFYTGFRRIGGYSFRRLTLLRWQATRVAMMWGITVALLLLLGFVGKESETLSRGWALSWVVTALGLLLVERRILQLAIARWQRQGHLVRNLVIVGAGDPGQRFVAKLQNLQDKSIAIRGIFDDRASRPSRVPASICGLPVRGTTDDLLDFARREAVDEVIVALPFSAEQRLRALFDKLRLLPVDLRLSAEPVAAAFPVRGISYLGDVPMLEVIERPIKNWNAVAKSIEDKVLGGLLFAVLAPVMAIIALAIKANSRGPVFFVQERFGFNNEVIRVLKFRTMYVDRGDASGAAPTLRADPRVTAVGRRLRALSLDELPQLINVLKGDMSLVGPRPHPITMKAGDRSYPDAVSEYLYRHRVKPGITGWAQANGLRGEVDTIEKARARVEHDLYYIEHWSIWLDLKTLLMTVPMLLSRRNAY